MLKNKKIINFLVCNMMLMHLHLFCIDNYTDESLMIVFGDNNFDNLEQEIFPLYDIDNYQESEPVSSLETLETIEEQPLQVFTITFDESNSSLLLSEQGFNFNQNCIKISKNHKENDLPQVDVVVKKQKNKNYLVKKKN